MFGMHVQLTARPGHGDELAALLLEGADGLASVEACRFYLVSRSPDDPDTMWVTEAWTDAEAHAESLRTDATKALMAHAMPLIGSPPETVELRPVGGKGLLAEGSARDGRARE